MISYGICLSLSDLLHLVWWSLVASLLLQMALFCSFLWLSSVLCVSVCVSILLCPSFCWTFRLFSCLGCCQCCCRGTCILSHRVFLWIHAQEWDCWLIWQFYFLVFHSGYTSLHSTSGGGVSLFSTLSPAFTCITLFSFFVFLDLSFCVCRL